MPSFAELKEKAAKAKDAGISKIQHTRDMHTSVPLKKTNWDPYSKQPPPPPPPPRTNSWSKPSAASLYIPPPPPVRRGTASSYSGSPSIPSAPEPPRISPRAPPPSAPGPPQVKRATRPPAISSQNSTTSIQSGSQQSFSDIDWSNISEADKATFFAWLDEYFEKSFGIRA